MQFKQFDDKFVIRVDKGEEIVTVLKSFVIQNDIKSGLITGIGAVNEVKIGFFDTVNQKYHSKELKEDFEIVSLLGNISRMNGEPYLHLHINLAGKDYRSFGGHLNHAYVSATCEVLINTINGEINREFSPESGINLFKI